MTTATPTVRVGQPITVTVNYSDAGGPRLLQILLTRDGDVITVLNEALVANGSRTFTFTPRDPLSVGDHAVSARVVDDASNPGDTFVTAHVNP